MMMTQSGFRRWLKVVAKVDGGSSGRSDESLIVRYGKVFTRKRITRSERIDLIRLLNDVHAFKVGECFMNAGKLSLEHDLVYCEGLAAGPWPVYHAWISWRNLPIDVTWPVSWKSAEEAYYKPSSDGSDIFKRVEYNVENCCYAGVEIPATDLRRIVLKTKTWGGVVRTFLN